MKRTRTLLLISGAGIVAVFALAAYIYTDTNTLEPKRELRAIEEEHKDVFRGIRDELPSLVDAWGVSGVLDLTAEAMKNNKIGMFHCHVLNHLIGHHAIVQYGTDYEALMDHESQFCELGYRHGAEAQIVHTADGNIREELYAFCEVLQEHTPEARCYHGAGHAIMNDTLDVGRSLEFCDSLVSGPAADITSCHKAVFAELTNLVGGSDGETGEAYANGPPMSIAPQTPLEYCTEWGEAYQEQCLFELSGLGVSPASTPGDITEKLKNCTQDGYTEDLQAACISSVAAVSAQHELAKRETITFQKQVLSWPDRLREAYLRGSAQEMRQYFLSGTTRDWRSFCYTFERESDQELCAGYFSDM